jgi:hypothetical protein
MDGHKRSQHRWERHFEGGRVGVGVDKDYDYDISYSEEQLISQQHTCTQQTKNGSTRCATTIRQFLFLRK